MVCRIMASIELGVCADNTHYLAGNSASENTPVATRAPVAPHQCLSALLFEDQTYAINLTADGRPFGIERTLTDTRSYLFFPVIEADCATEPIEISGSEQSSTPNVWPRPRSFTAPIPAFLILSA